MEITAHYERKLREAVTRARSAFDDLQKLDSSFKRQMNDTDFTAAVRSTGLNSPNVYSSPTRRCYPPSQNICVMC